jgi:hypothetical protein
MAANTHALPNNSVVQSASSNGIRNTVNNVASHYNAGIFFDNDERHIIEVNSTCTAIHTVKIPESPKPLAVKKIENMDTYVADISARLRTIREPALRDRLRSQANINKAFTYYLTLPDFSENLYVECIYNWAKHIDTVWDFRSGLGDEHISQLNEWIIGTADIPDRVAIFDWDRTLTQFEGFIAYNSVMDWIRWKQSTTSDTMITTLAKFHEDTLVFLLGGMDRLRKIRSMFHDLQERGIAVCILTNNGACTDGVDNPIYMLIGQLLGNNNFTLLCSRPAPFKGNKGLTLQHQSKFRKLCAKMSEGGARRRRVQKSKRQTKTRKLQKRK